MTWTNGPGGGLDPVYKVHWAGSSEGGPDGNERWGLDADDYALTKNHVCMDTYLNAVEAYRQFCREQGYDTVPIFTTGPVDWSEGEKGFQREIKHQYIRDFVAADPERVLFDYADILVYNNAGEKHESIWNDGGTPRKHAQIHLLIIARSRLTVPILAAKAVSLEKNSSFYGLALCFTFFSSSFSTQP